MASITAIYFPCYDILPGENWSIERDSYYPQLPLRAYIEVSNVDDLEYFNDIVLVRMKTWITKGFTFDPRKEPDDIVVQAFERWDKFYLITNEIPLGDRNPYERYWIHIDVEFLDTWQDELGYLRIERSDIRGVLGRPSRKTESSIPSNLIINTDPVSFTVCEDLSGLSPATFMRSRKTGAAEFKWSVRCPDGTTRSLEDAIAEGFVRGSTSGYFEDLPAEEERGEFALGSTGTITPLVAGNYRLYAEGTYWTDINCEVITNTSGSVWVNTGIWTSTTSNSISFTAYSPASPSIEIESVTPAVWMNDDPTTDPLMGMPPYTVKWKDTSKTTDPNQIPQKTIIWDFGDSDTGSANYATEENTKSSLIVAKSQTHIYDGYGPFVCRMTIVDKHGNEKTATATFAPSTEPRMIKNPTATPLSGGQPLLVEGRGYVAGKPEPTVEWEFELLDAAEEEYYSGGKEGKYVELSLLEAGTYSLVSRVVDVSGITITEVEFDIEVTEAPVYENNPVAMNNFDVWVYQNSERVDILQPASHAKYVDRYAHEKAVTFQVPSDYEYLQCLRIDNEFDFGYLGEARRMVVVSFEESEDGTYVTISGKDYASYIFGYRVATVATQSTSGNGKDTQRHSGETLMRYFAMANLNTNEREVPRFRVLGRSANRGGTCVYSARYDKIVDIIDSLCTLSGLGWDASLQATGNESVGWRVIEGVDRTFANGGTGAVIFSARVDGLRNADIGAFSEYSSPNLAIGAGMGDGATREYTEYGETMCSGLSRREVFVDAGDKAELDEVELTCLAKLKDLEDRSIYVYPHKECPWVFGVDYKVGDYVSIETKSGIMMDMQIVSAELSNYAGEGEVLLLKCGVDERSTRTVLRELELGNTYSKK